MRLIMQTAIEAEVTEPLGRDRQTRGSALAKRTSMATSRRRSDRRSKGSQTSWGPSAHPQERGVNVTGPYSRSEGGSGDGFFLFSHPEHTPRAPLFSDTKTTQPGSIELARTCIS